MFDSSGSSLTAVQTLLKRTKRRWVASELHIFTLKLTLFSILSLSLFLRTCSTPQIRVRMEMTMPDPEQSFQYFEALDERLAQKQSRREWEERTARRKAERDALHTERDRLRSIHEKVCFRVQQSPLPPTT